MEGPEKSVQVFKILPGGAVAGTDADGLVPADQVIPAGGAVFRRKRAGVKHGKGTFKGGPVRLAFAEGIGGRARGEERGQEEKDEQEGKRSFYISSPVAGRPAAGMD